MKLICGWHRGDLKSSHMLALCTGKYWDCCGDASSNAIDTTCVVHVFLLLFKRSGYYRFVIRFLHTYANICIIVNTMIYLQQLRYCMHANNLLIKIQMYTIQIWNVNSECCERLTIVIHDPCEHQEPVNIGS